MTYYLSYSCSCSDFSSFSCFMNIFIHIAFPILSLFHAYTIWNFRYLYDMMPIHTSFMYSCPSMHLLFLGIGINPIGSSKLKLWHETSRFTDFTEGRFEIFIFQCLVSIFDTGSLYSFKAKVLRILIQLESPKSKHQNLSYVRNNSDYSMIN